MGNKNARQKIENEHHENLEEIRRLRDRDEQEAKLKELLYRNNYEVSMEEIKRELENYILEHEAKMEELSIKRDEVNYNHQDRVKELDQLHLRENKKEDNRHEEEIKKIVDNFTNE